MSTKKQGKRPAQRASTPQPQPAKKATSAWDVVAQTASKLEGVPPPKPAETTQRWDELADGPDQIDEGVSPKPESEKKETLTPPKNVEAPVGVSNSSSNPSAPITDAEEKKEEKNSSRPNLWNSKKDEEREFLLSGWAQHPEMITPKEIKQSIWGDQSPSGVQGVARELAPLLTKETSPQFTKILNGKLAKAIYSGDERPLESFIVEASEELIEESSNPKTVPKKKAKQPELFEPNPIFSVRQDNKGQKRAMLELLFSDLPEEHVESIIYLIDTFAFSVKSPAEVIRKKSIGPNVKGGFRRRVNANLSIQEIIDECTNVANVRGIILGRIQNPSAAYKQFLEVLSNAGNGEMKTMNWSWGEMCDFFCTQYKEQCEKIVEAGADNLVNHKIIGVGAYGPLAWRIQPDNLLKIHMALAKSLLPQFKAKKDNTLLEVPKEMGDLSLLLNIPLCGGDCQSYLNPGQLRTRVNLGIPWIKYAKDSKSTNFGKVIEASQFRNILNKSASEYRSFLASQRKEIRRKPRTGTTKASKPTSRFSVDDWD